MSEEIQQTTETTAPQLTLGDLTLALNTIQVVAQRGAIRADEMELVGGLHTRLFKFLEAQGAIQPAQPAQPEATENEATDSAAE